MQAGGGGAADVHRHRVADVGDAVAVDAGEVRVGVVEDRRVGLGDADDVAVDDAAHLDAVARPDLADAGAAQHGLDLPGRVGDDAERHAAARSSAPSAATLSGIGQRHSAAVRVWPSTAAASSTSSSATPIERHVGPVVLAPVALLGALGRLDRHRRVVGAAMAVDVGGAAVVREQRAEHRRVGQHEHAAGVEPDGVEAGIAAGQPPPARSEGRCCTRRAGRAPASGRRRRRRRRAASSRQLDLVVVEVAGRPDRAARVVRRGSRVGDRDVRDREVRDRDVGERDVRDRDVGDRRCPGS